MQFKIISLICFISVFACYSQHKENNNTYPPNQGQINFNLSLHAINNFYMQPEGSDDRLNTGFWGVGSGLDYYYSDGRFINLSATMATDVIIPIIGAADLSGEYDVMATAYLSLTDNFHAGNFTFGYGICYAKNLWEEFTEGIDYAPDFGPELQYYKSTAYGFILNSYYNWGRSINLGIIYRPTLYQISPESKSKYEHFISIALKWKMQL